MFFTSRFTLVKEHLVEFNQLAMANADGLEHMLNRVMPKDNIGLAALLQTTENAWDNGKWIFFLTVVSLSNLINCAKLIQAQWFKLYIFIKK